MTQRITLAEYRAAPARRKPRVEREHYEQVALFTWAKLQEKAIPELALLFAIPNGGKRDKRTAARLKAEGVKAGVSDTFLAVARARYHGLFIELKAEGGRPTQSQIDWARAVTAQGYCACFCHGAEQAKKAILTYLRYGPPLGEGVE